jgi:hypothetical protein
LTFCQFLFYEWRRRKSELRTTLAQLDKLMASRNGKDEALELVQKALRQIATLLPGIVQDA